MCYTSIISSYIKSDLKIKKLSKFMIFMDKTVRQKILKYQLTPSYFHRKLFHILIETFLNTKTLTLFEKSGFTTTSQSMFHPYVLHVDS